VVCVSNWCARVLKETLRLDSTVIYNGHLKNEAIVEMPETVERKKFTFSMIARGISQKGWDVAIKAFLRVIETKDAQLVLVGAGDFLSDLQKRFDHPAILYKGQMSSIEQVVRDTDIGLFPSRKYEAFGLSILDFFSQGKPVLASNLGGIPEVIEDGLGAGGLLIQMKDKEEPDVDHLAKLMIEIMNDKLMRNSLSKNAIRIARRFDFRKTVAEYEQICLSVIEK
jgi:glycosyltransferase involved in cell wall biosynthesis